MESIVSTQIKERWETLKTENPTLRIRNAATQLGVPEVSLLVTQCGESVTRLRPEFQAILGEIESLGPVMALSRNDDAVHERKGIYKNASLHNPGIGLFVEEDIDLRLFFHCWGSVFAVSEMMGDKKRLSIQFFAKDGEAIHKIYLTERSAPNTYQQLVSKYQSENQAQEEPLMPKTALIQEQADDAIQVDSFRKDWLNLKDTHDFHGLLRQYGLTRTQALRLAPVGNYAVPLQPKALREALTLASQKQVEIMVFVGNQGILQIHTGPVNKLLERDGWFNVLDPEFNLHVREAAVSSCWVVRKPTVDGIITAIECYDARGQQIIQLFGKRKPGIPELAAWTELVASIEKTFSLL